MVRKIREAHNIFGQIGSEEKNQQNVIIKMTNAKTNTWFSFISKHINIINLFMSERKIKKKTLESISYLFEVINIIEADKSKY